MKRKSYPSVNIGSASMLLVFIVLCLTTLSSLSLSSSVSDYNYSQSIADRNTAYYTASNEAETLLAKIDNVLMSQWTANKTTYDKLSAEDLIAIDTIDTDSLQTEHTIQYHVEIDTSTALSVKLYIYPSAEVTSSFYEILEWKEVSTSEWNADESMNLMEGK